MFTASANGRSVVGFPKNRSGERHPSVGEPRRTRHLVQVIDHRVARLPLQIQERPRGPPKVFRFFHAPRMQRGIVLKAMSGRRLHLLREARKGKIAKVFF